MEFEKQFSNLKNKINKWHFITEDYEILGGLRDIRDAWSGDDLVCSTVTGVKRCRFYRQSK